MFEKIFALLSARRMGLRDRGKIRRKVEIINYEDYIEVKLCSVCRTRIRVGIRKTDNVVVEYCWRCERLTNIINPSEKRNDKPPKRGNLILLKTEDGNPPETKR